MKQTSLFLFSLIISLSIFSQNRKKCGFDKIYEQLIKDEQFVIQQRAFNDLVKDHQQDKIDTVVYIAVVVHVVYKNSRENIPYDQIKSQIDVLNRDFRKMNADTTNVKAGFSKSDVKIEFQLALKDPDGKPTYGVTRTPTTIDNVGNTSQYYRLRPAWNSNLYLNIWVCDVGSQKLGFAYIPNAPGVDPDEDGVVIGTDYFGTIGTAMAPYDKGRTATHEVGHFFNLMHPWGGSNPNCITDDQVADTPEQGVEVYDCPSSNISCMSEDMLSNFMQYVDDACMGNFTLGQKNRMRTVLYSSRDSLQYSGALGITGLNENNPLAITEVFPNPSKGQFEVSIPREIDLNQLELTLSDLHGRLIPFRTIQHANRFTIDVKNAPKGVYFIRVNSRENSITKKMILH